MHWEDGDWSWETDSDDSNQTSELVEGTGSTASVELIFDWGYWSGTSTSHCSISYSADLYAYAKAVSDSEYSWCEAEAYMSCPSLYIEPF